MLDETGQQMINVISEYFTLRIKSWTKVEENLEQWVSNI